MVEGKKLRGRKVLKIFGVIILIVGLFMIVWPFYPAIRYYIWPQRLSVQAEEIVRLANSPFPSSPTVTPSPFGGSPSLPQPPGPMIIIPKIGLEARIVPDLSWDNLMAGVGHDPNTKNPGEDGVCILYGHRFLNYIDPSTGYFYLLDKLVPGDLVVVYWEKKAFRYIVKESVIVEPTDFSIYNERPAPTLVMVTCTPLWTDRYRLVVFAELEEARQEPIQ